MATETNPINKLLMKVKTNVVNEESGFESMDLSKSVQSEIQVRIIQLNTIIKPKCAFR